MHRKYNTGLDLCCILGHNSGVKWKNEELKIYSTLLMLYTSGRWDSVNATLLATQIIKKIFIFY